MLTPGPELGVVVAVPELHWHAQTVPHYDYLLREPRRASILAGGHCIPVNIPSPERLAWHKLYSSANRLQDLAKADKDLLQAATLLTMLVECDDLRLADCVADVPGQVLEATQRRLPSLRKLLVAIPGSSRKSIRCSRVPADRAGR